MPKKKPLKLLSKNKKKEKNSWRQKKKTGWQMKYTIAKFLILSIAICLAFSQNREINNELKRLIEAKKSLEIKLQKNTETLKKIEKEKKELEKLKKEIEELQKSLTEKRYKKLAKAFEKMEPEMAGEKLSKIDNPKKAALILYNMKPKSAGEALNFIDSKRVSEIVKILTKLKNGE
jgi:flagellar motility protein MotE (MotC chaperone)